MSYICMYNRSFIYMCVYMKHLQDTDISLRDVRITDHEIIFQLDSKSKDGILEICRRFCSLFPLFRC